MPTQHYGDSGMFGGMPSNRMMPPMQGGMRTQHYGDGGMFGMNRPMPLPQGMPQMNGPMATWQGMHHQPQQQQPLQSSDGFGDPAGGIDYQSRAGRMRNAARQQNALQGYGAQGFGGMNALQGFRTGY